MKTKVSTELCLTCPRMKKMQMTPEGFKFCRYCHHRRDYLKEIPFDDHPSTFTFREDTSMGIENYLHHWKTKRFECPKCGCTEFYVDVEMKNPPDKTEGIFKAVPTQRSVIICKTDPKHRFCPDETMTILPKGIK